jgi:hypothetical protein
MTSLIESTVLLGRQASDSCNLLVSGPEQAVLAGAHAPLSYTRLLSVKLAGKFGVEPKSCRLTAENNTFIRLAIKTYEKNASSFSNITLLHCTAMNALGEFSMLLT